MSRAPAFEQGEGGDRVRVGHPALVDEAPEFLHGEGAAPHVLLLELASRWHGRQVRRKEDIEPARGSSVPGVKEAEVLPGRGLEAGLLDELHLGHLLSGHAVGLGDGPLRELPEAGLDGVAVLLDEVVALTVERDDEGEVPTAHHGIQAPAAVASLDDILGQGRPGILIDDLPLDAAHVRVARGALVVTLPLVRIHEPDASVRRSSGDAIPRRGRVFAGEDGPVRARPTISNDLSLDLGEGPVWDSARHRLWWVDSEAGAVFRGRLEGDALRVEERLELGEKVGSIAPASDGGLLVAGEHHVHVLDAGGGRSAAIRVIPEGQRSRLNDGVVDPAGRFLVGSIRLDDRTGEECVWSVDPDRRVREVLHGITVSNGMGFSPSGDTLFHVETRPGTIRAFDYDVSSGQASRGRVVLDCGGTPDGLAVDSAGNLWVAFFGEGQVRCLTPEGDVVDTIDVAAPNATCPEFAGPDLRRLVITTALFRMDDEGRRRWPLAGRVFVVDVEVPGLPTRAWAGSTA